MDAPGVAAGRSGAVEHPRPLRSTDLLLIALGMALLSSFCQLALLAIWKFRSGYVIRLGLDAVWMTPIAVTAVYAIPALLLLSLSRVWPRVATLPVVAGTFVLLATIDIAVMERRIALWSLWLLALGIGVQAGRLADRHRTGFLRAMRWSVASVLLVAVLGAAAVQLEMARRERTLLDSLPPARAAAPNVLFFILDTVRAQSLSLYGYHRATTPTLERLAARGTVFERAIAPGAWTLPSHGSMFTGHWPHRIASWWQQPRRAPVPTLPEVLARHGYRTGGFVANWWSLGWESGLAQGFSHYDDLGHSPGQVMRGSAIVRWLSERRGLRRAIGMYETLGRRRAPEVSRSLVRWIGNGDDRPFFAFVNYLDAHSPYLPPAPFDRMFGVDVSEREPVVMEELSREADLGAQVASIETAAYDGSIAYLDDHLRRLFERLEAQGALANTIVIIAADHGEQIGEHGLWGHGGTLRAQTVHVPLLLFGPGIPAGRRIAQPTSLRNIAATIAALTGADASRLGGASLARFWTARPGAVIADTVLAERGRQRSLYTARYHFFDDEDGFHLFDHVRDPREERDLIASDVAASIMPELQALLAGFSVASAPVDAPVR